MAARKVPSKYRGTAAEPSAAVLVNVSGTDPCLRCSFLGANIQVQAAVEHVAGEPDGDGGEGAEGSDDKEAGAVHQEKSM